MKISFKMLSKSRNAFTIIELSVVVLILALLISTVLVSKALIDSAKINKIQEEYRGLSNAISLFQDAYECIPGDCNTRQISQLITSGLNATCVGSSLTLNNSQIWDVTKRTCAMHELELGGYINGVDHTYSTLTDSIANSNIPLAQFSKLASWDFRLATDGTASTPPHGGYVFPIEAGLTGGSLANIANKHMLVLRAAILISNGPDIALTTLTSASVLSILPANLTKKLDSKFDDGLPYFGRIVAGKNPGQLASSSSCTNIAFASALPMSITDSANITNAVSYISSNNTGINGCIVAYILSDI